MSELVNAKTRNGDATMKRRTLFDITADLQSLDDILEEVGGDISDPLAARAIDAWFEELDRDFENKVDNYAALITELQARATARKAEADRMAALARVDDNAARGLKDRLKLAMEMRGIDKIDTARFRVSIAKNGGKQQVDVSVPAEQLPEAFRRVIVAPDTDAIREALERGEEIDGCCLMERGTHLRIK